MNYLSFHVRSVGRRGRRVVVPKAHMCASGKVIAGLYVELAPAKYTVHGGKKCVDPDWRTKQARTHL